MDIALRYLKDKDLFELQIIEPRLRSHLLLTRKALNDLRGVIERALLESKAKKNG